MTITFSVAATQTFLTMLNGLANVLKKAEANALERKIDPSVFLNSRLAPDMFPLVRQVQISTDSAKGVVHRLAGRDIPKMEDNETTFAELQARIAKTIDMVKAIPASELDGQEAREIIMKRPSGDVTFNGQDYLLIHGLPNFLFHVVTAYNILRHNGVPIGKEQYFGRA